MASGGNAGSSRADLTHPSYPPSGVAVVLGGADTVWDDLKRALELVEDPVVIAVNDAIGHVEIDIDHGVTLHPEKLVGEFHPVHNPDCVSWIRDRAERGYNTDYETWSRRDPEWVDHVINHWGAGSSGLFGVTVAYYLGIERIVLCGVPMTPTSHFDGATGTEDGDGNWDEVDVHWPAWEKKEKRLRGRVKSMSGQTRKLLGEPDEKWLEVREAA